MAKKRMFSLTVLETDAFMDLPLSTQALYFHLNLRADDDGFVGNPKRITQNIGASTDDLNLLLAKRFLLQFDNGVVVVKHWRMHNNISRNRYNETNYVEYKNQLLLKGNGAYSFTEGVPIDDTRLIESSKRQISAPQSAQNNIDATKTQHRRNIDAEKTHPGLDLGLEKDKDIYIYAQCADENAQKSAQNDAQCASADSAQNAQECASTELFEIFYKAYPKKKDRPRAEKAFKKLKVDETLLNTMLKAIERQKKSREWTKDNGQFIPYPASWLNGRRWEDELTENESDYDLLVKMAEGAIEI